MKVAEEGKEKEKVEDRQQEEEEVMQEESRGEGRGRIEGRKKDGGGSGMRRKRIRRGGYIGEERAGGGSSIKFHNKKMDLLVNVCEWKQSYCEKISQSKGLFQHISSSVEVNLLLSVYLLQFSFLCLYSLHHETWRGGGEAA